MALYFWHFGWELSEARYIELLEELALINPKISMVLGQTEQIRKIAYNYSQYKNFFFLGRSYELPIAMEWSLKLKEITYLHSEAYSSGELKHGPIALIDENFPTIMINGNGPLHTKNMSSVEEICSRSGKVIGIISKNDPHTDIYNDTIPFEPSIPEFNPFLETVILQIFAYCMADHLWRDVDKPRNLAKSVTVE
jgi:glucosamine--fructose-6-phosphate aminotransferase (isomerizing)